MSRARKAAKPKKASNAAAKKYLGRLHSEEVKYLHALARAKKKPTSVRATHTAKITAKKAAHVKGAHKATVAAHRVNVVDV